MQVQPTFSRQKELGIHPDVQLNVADIPQNAPKEVKAIMNVKVPGVGLTPMTCKLDPKTQLVKQLEIAEKLKEKGYNPLDYRLDVEEITLKLKQMDAMKEYKALQDCSEYFEQARKDSRGSLRRVPSKYFCQDNGRKYVYCYGTHADFTINDFTEACDKYREATPWWERIFKPVRKNAQNPYPAQLEQKKAILDELAHKLSECVFVKEKTSLVNKALKTFVKQVYMNITGETGIYNPTTREGWARNAAYNVMQHDRQVKSSNSKDLDEIEFENIRYSMLQQATKDEYVKDAKIYADESIKALSDKGKVSKEDFIPKDVIPAMREMLTKFFNVIDLNNDGYIDINENTAHVMVMDCAKISDDLENVTMENADGIIDSHNKKNIDRYILERPEQAKQLLKEQNIQ